MRCGLYRLAVAGLLAGGLAAYAQAPAARIPVVRGTVLSGETVELPAALKGKVGVLVLGFSQAAKDQVTDWGKRLAGEYRGAATVVYYEMPVVEAVPRLLRGWVTKKMGESVPDRAKGTFLPITEHEKEWKAVAGYGKSDQAYVLVVDEDGVVRGKLEGAVTDAGFGEVKRQVEGLR